MRGIRNWVDEGQLVGLFGLGGLREQTICFLWSGLWRSMCTRWTFEGSSCGRRGWRAAGAVVNGVGMASELVLTAVAGLANDFAARLLTAMLGYVDPMRLCS